MSESEEHEVKDGNLQMPSDEAADLVMKICSLYVMPHYVEQFEAGKVLVESEADNDEKLVKAKSVLATCVFNYHVNLAVKALLEEKEREKKESLDLPWKE